MGSPATCSLRWSVLPRSSARAVAALVVARALMEGIAFAALLAVAHAVSGGRAELPTLAAAAAVTGVALVLIAALRETATETRGSVIVVGTLLVSLALAAAVPTRGLEPVGWLGRLILFAGIGEAFLWRVVSIARGAVRWDDARNAAPFAAICLAAAAIAPLAIDRTPLAALALALVAASGMALSLARSTEELSLLRERTPHAAARLSSVTSVVFALGVAAIAGAIASPLIERILRETGEALGPPLENALFLILLPLGYAAAFVALLLEPILRRLDLSFVRRYIAPSTPEENAALLREIERTRPIVVGGLELLVVLVVVAVALVLFDRTLRDRRITLPEGAELERRSASGLTLADTLRSLFPRHRRRRHRPRDDGTPGAELRILYWRLLELGERSGHGWRHTSETPDEHRRRLTTTGPHWRAASPLVGAFEALRYGEIDPDAASLARARAALRAVEAAART
jgi:uncharacterized protein DUF4129